MENKQKKILYFLNDLDNGGKETFCLNVNKKIIDDNYKIDYFLTLGNKEYYKNEVEKLGGKVINIKNENTPFFILNFIKIFYLINNQIKKEKYDVIHIHQCKGVISILIAAYINRIKCICIHSHSAFTPENDNRIIKIKIKLYSIIRNKIIKRLNPYRLGCSKEACKEMFGEKCFDNNKTKVIFNGISFEKFNKNDLNVNEIRKKYNIDKNNINLINIGRFDEQKNQIFLLEIFNELKSIRENIKLTIIGHGDLEYEIKNEIKRLGIEQWVDILPQDTNIPEILSVMDYFLLPSLYEGLGIVLIEAQAMGVQCFASNYVPEEADIGLCEFLPLEIGAKKWAKTIDKYIEENKYGKIDYEKLSKYDIKNVVLELEKIYSNNN